MKNLSDSVRLPSFYVLYLRLKLRLTEQKNRKLDDIHTYIGLLHGFGKYKTAFNALVWLEAEYFPADGSMYPFFLDCAELCTKLPEPVTDNFKKWIVLARKSLFLAEEHGDTREILEARLVLAQRIFDLNKILPRADTGTTWQREITRVEKNAKWRNYKDIIKKAHALRRKLRAP